MRILLDECVPRPLKTEFAGHDVHTVAEMEWAGKRNGELLQLMAGQAFEVLLTVDRSMRYQQNLQTSGVAVLILVAPSNRLGDLVLLIPSALAALRSLKPGDVLEIVA